jgi:hypothetical protein
VEETLRTLASAIEEERATEIAPVAPDPRWQKPEE